MSALLLPALAAGSSGRGALYVDDVFSTYLYTGNGSQQAINNGIDLAGKGGLVWNKRRDNSIQHFLEDTVRGVGSALWTASDTANVGGGVASFNSNGFTISSSISVSGSSNVSWTFRKAPKFFDVVTYMGNGVAGRQIAHSLGVQAGFITAKATSTTGDWDSYHRSATGDLKLNLTNAQTASRAIITAADASTFTVSGAANTNGVSYVAYLWAHDPSAEGIIQCGSYTGSNQAVNLGWEPQFVMIKRTDLEGNWITFDTFRNLTANGAADTGSISFLLPNTSGAEITESGATRRVVATTSTGFYAANDSSVSGGTYIYLAIRRPNKPPTSGTQVYSSSTASGVVSAGFPVDLHIGATRTGAASNHAMHTRLTGGTKELVTSATAAEATITDLGFDSMTGLKASLPSGMVNHFFRRATGFMDVVCYTGTGVVRTVNHNLGVAPALMIVKKRTNSLGGLTNWAVYQKDLTPLAGTFLYLNTADARQQGTGVWGAVPPTSSVFTVGIGDPVNTNTDTYVAYLFATLPGISKVGSYTGNGSSQTIDCGFSTGARLFLVKATSTTGSWWVYDSARGIVSAADPALQLNSTAAEITSADAVDPASVGIVVNQEATCSINATGVSYIFLAIA